MDIVSSRKVHNAIFGSAYGDAWGYRQEFKDFATISAQKPEFPVKTAFITDDTQMGLAAMKAVLDNWTIISTMVIDSSNEMNFSRHMRLMFAYEFIEWSNDPRNNRAPGNTCMTALYKLEDSAMRTGLEGSQRSSKGCGANMRNPWFGLLPLSEDSIIRLSLLQAEVTHSHPLALSSAVLTALATKAVFDGTVTLATGNNELFKFVTEKTHQLLEMENKRATPLNAIYTEGLIQLKDFLASRSLHVEEFANSPINMDPCVLLKSDGWVAEEALLVSVVIADTHGDNPVEALRRVVYTSGDSDSMAAIAGTFVGAAHSGIVFPNEWATRLEPDYLEELNSRIDQISAF